MLKKSFYSFILVTYEVDLVNKEFISNCETNSESIINSNVITNGKANSLIDGIPSSKVEERYTLTSLSRLNEDN